MSAFFEASTSEGPLPTLERRSDGTALLRDLPIFRAGSFRCSQGIQRTFDRSDLTEIAANFKRLRPHLPNVPARADHSRSVDSVRGYISGVRRREDFLLADVELTEPDAVDKWERGTYRSRSAEIGPYRTNDDTVWNNVLLGLAFVDLPAVEGLFSLSGEPIEDTELFLMEEDDMSTKGGKNPATFNKDAEQDPKPDAEQDPDTDAEQDPKPDTEQDPKPDTEQDPKPDVEVHASKATFTIGGQPMTEAEIAAKFAKMDELAKTAAAFERFQADTLEREIATFTAALVEDNKIMGPQAEPLGELARMLDAAQFAKLREVFDATPGHPVLARFDIADTAATTASADVLEQSLAAFRASGMTEADIKQTSTYKDLEALKGAN